MAKRTKIRLVNAAGELAAEWGIDSVSTRAVAERSGENIGSIHYHFGGKGGLFEAVVLEAIREHTELGLSEIFHFSEPTTPALQADEIRRWIKHEVDVLFRSDRPAWHALVISQLMQRDDALNTLFEERCLLPSKREVIAFFKRIDPLLADDDAFLRFSTVKMTLFSHANYKKSVLKWIGADGYSESYLSKLEDVLIRQSLALFQLPFEDAI